MLQVARERRFRVKGFCFIIVLHLHCWPPLTAIARTSPRPDPVGVGVQQADVLQLTATVLDTRYCKGFGSDTLQMKLALRYVNTGAKPVILYRGAAIILQEFVSVSAVAAQSKEYEVNALVTHVTDGRSGHDLDGDAPGGAFVTLDPGASYETSTNTALVVDQGGASSERGEISAGAHVLQVTVSTWPASRELAERLAARWQDPGGRWWGDISLPPMAFRGGGRAAGRGRGWV